MILDAAFDHYHNYRWFLATAILYESSEEVMQLQAYPRKKAGECTAAVY